MREKAGIVFKDKIAKHPEAKKLYKRGFCMDAEDAIRVIVKARKWAGLTQQQIAKEMRVCTKTVSVIEKVDFFSRKYSPSLGSLMKYAAAFGFKLEIKFVPIK